MVLSADVVAWYPMAVEFVWAAALPAPNATELVPWLFCPAA